MANGPPDPSTTYRLVELQHATLEALRKRASERISLAVYHLDGVETAVLPPGAPVVVGRRPPQGLTVPDGSLSRAHARFTLREDGVVVVEDLASTNGVWVAGKRVPSAELKPGDDVVLGNVLACLRVLGAAEPADRPVSRVSTAADRAPIAVAPAMRAVLELAERVAGASVPVILYGETGCGKEVLARFLHEHGPRRGKPMVCVNCAAIPSQLVESTLFGHERGAFTGAGQRQKGVFEEADGGTVFLDEIGELPPPAQAALLRVLETRRFSRVGSVKEISVDVRVIAATHRDLDAMCAEGRFRADLYYRLNTVVLTIPALRDRPEDIEPLAQRFLKDMSAGRHLRLAPDVMELLASYPFPGNVRELRNAIEHAVVVTRGDTITAADLPASLQRGLAGPASSRAPMSSSGAPTAAWTSPVAAAPAPPWPAASARAPVSPAASAPAPVSPAASARAPVSPAASARAPVSPAAPAPPWPAASARAPVSPAASPPTLRSPAVSASALSAAPPVPAASASAPPVPAVLPSREASPGDPARAGEAPASGDLRAHLQAYESRILLETLRATGWNQSEAARRLGVPIRTLSHKVKALGLKKPEP